MSSRAKIRVEIGVQHDGGMSVAQASCHGPGHINCRADRHIAEPGELRDDRRRAVVDLCRMSFSRSGPGE